MSLAVLSYAANTEEYRCSRCNSPFTIKVRNESTITAGTCLKLSTENKDTVIHCTTPFTQYYYFNGQKYDYDVATGEYGKEKILESIAYNLYLKSDEYKNLQRQQKEQDVKEQKESRTTLVTILLVTVYFIFASIYSINLARQNKIVFFNTRADLYACFGILAVPLLLIFIIGPYAFIAGIPVSLIYNIVKPISLNFRRASWYNIFLLISARLIIGLITPLLLIGQFMDMFERKKDEDAVSHALRVAVTTAIISGVVRLMHCLVNGEKLQDQKLMEALRPVSERRNT